MRTLKTKLFLVGLYTILACIFWNCRSDETPQIQIDSQKQALSNSRTDICYLGGSLLPGFTLNGSATLDGVDLLVTRDTTSQVASTFYNSPLSSTGDVHIRLKLKITSQNCYTPADGMAFVLQKNGPTALGAQGGGVGYQGINPSIAVEMDTYQNGGDPSQPHFAITRNGDPVHTSANNAGLPAPYVPPFSITYGTPFYSWLDYNAASTTIKVYTSQSSIKPTNPVIQTSSINIATYFGNQPFYVGFTGSTGGACSKHEIMEIAASDVVDANQVCCSTDADCAGSSLGPVCDPTKHVCAACIPSNVSACSQSQQACDISSSSNVCIQGCDGDFASNSAHACSSRSAPVCVTSGPSKGSCVACNGNWGSNTTYACGRGAPTCAFTTGFCSYCRTNTDCGGLACNTSNGLCQGCNGNFGSTTSVPCPSSLPYCNVPTGTCGSQCFNDSDCGDGNFCNTSAGSASCMQKTANGLPVPGGSCTPYVASHGCLSGACSVVDNACGKLLAETCNSNDQCRNSLCSGGACGRQNGESPCTVADAASTCQSGTCNPSANGSTSACIPLGAGKCWVDDDCGSGEFCMRSTFTCTAKVSSGLSLPTDGLHDTCAGGLSSACASGLCSVSNLCVSLNGAQCSAGAECASGVCGSNNLCGLAVQQQGCTQVNATEICQSGVCSPQSGVCLPSPGCWDDTDCGAGLHCTRNSYTCTTNIVVGDQIPNDGLHTGICNPSNSGSVCITGLCNSSENTCADSNNATCTNAKQCVINVCGSNNKCGLANGQQGCTLTDASRCQSGSCSSANVCIPDGSGKCWVDTDCPTSQHCRRDNFTCTDDLREGEAMPNDTLHNGNCGDQAALAVCATSSCNSITNTCAVANGLSCTSAKDCVVNVCGSNFRCGLEVGQLGCVTTAAGVCQSGACSVGGACIPAGAGKCWVDADCEAMQYCERNSYTCKAKVESGVQVPNDTLHDGTCTPQNAIATCASSSCNATSNTCSSPNNASCVGNIGCNSNICAQDGKCGQLPGKLCENESECREGTCVDNMCTVPNATATGNGWLKCTVGTVGEGSDTTPWLVGFSIFAVMGIRRRRMVAAAIIASTSLAGAAEPGFALDRNTPGEAGSTWTMADSLTYKQADNIIDSLSLRLGAAYSQDPLVIRLGQDNIITRIVGEQSTAFLGASLVLLPGLRLGVMMPGQVYASGVRGADANYVYNPPNSSFALGDLRLGLHYKLIDESYAKLAIGGHAFIATGDTAAYAGDGDFRWEPQVRFAGSSGVIAYAAQLGYLGRQREGEKFGAMYLSNELNGILALGLQDEQGKFVLGPEFKIAAPANDKVLDPGSRRSIISSLGLHYEFYEGWRYHLGGGLGVGDEIGTYLWSGSTALEWIPTEKKFDPSTQPEPKPVEEKVEEVTPPTPAPPPTVVEQNPDSDGDGIADPEDFCPNDAGVQSSIPGMNGCKGFATVKVQFRLNSDVFIESSEPVLEGLYTSLSKFPESVRFRIEGHTDVSGNEKQNLYLSKARAAAIVRWLVKNKRMNEKRFEAVGLGSSTPAFSNETLESRALNRRVEVHLIIN